MKEFLAYLPLIFSAVACGLSAWTTVRAERWRNSDALSALVERVRQLGQEQGLLAQRVGKIEEEIDHLPTKADIARVEGKIDGNSSITLRVEQAVIRLQDAWMNAKPTK